LPQEADPVIAMDAPPAGRAPLFWRIAPGVVFGLWIAVFLVVGAYLLAPHLLTLPAPAPGDAALHQALAAQRRPAQHDRWMVLHVLDEDCRCSRRVLDHLLSGPRPVDVVERVVLISHAMEPGLDARVRARGFELDVVTPEQLAARYHLEAAPLLIVVDPSDVVRYLGGYTPRKQADDVRDLAIIAALRHGDEVTALPTFGCAVGRSLRATVDPLGIRRWN